MSAANAAQVAVVTVIAADAAQAVVAALAIAVAAQATRWRKRGLCRESREREMLRERDLSGGEESNWERESDVSKSEELWNERTLRGM